MSFDSQLIKSLKMSGKRPDNIRPKEYIHFHKNTNSEWSPANESRTTGKINSIDLIYFLRACGSNTVSISLPPIHVYSNVSQLKNPDISGAIFTLSFSILILNSLC